MQCVLFKNSMSRDIKLLSGVPQYSHLGPLIFVNDLPNMITKSEADEWCYANSKKNPYFTVLL